MKEPHFCLRWNDFQANFTSEFENLREEENFIDVTLACSGKLIKAHKVVLSACSQFFKYILKENPCKHPVIVMQETSYSHLKSLIDFMYTGEVNVIEDDLPSFLQIANNLKIRGLMDDSRQFKDNYGVITKQIQPEVTDGKEQSCSNEENQLSEKHDFASNFAHLPQTENKIYEDTSLSSVSSDNVKTVDASIEYSSDEDMRPDMAMSFLEIDTADSRSSHQPVQNKTDVKCGNVETKNCSMEVQSNHFQGTAEFTRYQSLEPRACPSCGRLYSNTSNLRQHIRLIHKPESMTCPLCSKLFKSKLYLKRHLVSFHELDKTKASNQDLDRYRKLDENRTVLSNTCSSIEPVNTGCTENVYNNNYSNFLMSSSSIVPSVTNENNPSVFHGDFLPLDPLEPDEMNVVDKLPDRNHNLLNESSSLSDNTSSCGGDNTTSQQLVNECYESSPASFAPIPSQLTPVCSDNNHLPADSNDAADDHRRHYYRDHRNDNIDDRCDNVSDVTVTTTRVL